ncbi:hypothetical protein GCM10020256_47080 [Streptomyces thermocoprophilus]
MRDARAEEEGLAGLEPDVVEQERGEDARVAGVVVGECGVGRVVAAEAVAGGGGLGDGVGDVRTVGGEDRGEDLAEGGVLRVGVQQVDVRLEGVDAEAVEEVRGVRGLAGSRTARRTR